MNNEKFGMLSRNQIRHLIKKEGGLSPVQKLTYGFHVKGCYTDNYRGLTSYTENHIYTVKWGNKIDMPLPLLLIIIPPFILFGISVMRGLWIEAKIMNRLKEIDPDEWNRLVWRLGSWVVPGFFWGSGGRAHPFRLLKYLKNPTTNDPQIEQYVTMCRKTNRFTLIIWIIFAVIVLAVTGLGIFLNYTI